jgi:hypothetical protein
MIMAWINRPVDTGYESALAKTPGSSAGLFEKGVCICIGGVGICTCTCTSNCTSVCAAPESPKAGYSSAFKGLAV